MKELLTNYGYDVELCHKRYRKHSIEVFYRVTNYDEDYKRLQTFVNELNSICPVEYSFYCTFEGIIKCFIYDYKSIKGDVLNWKH